MTEGSLGAATASAVATTDMWELRWTAPALPEVEHIWPEMPTEPSSSIEIEDQDIYLLTGSSRINLKLRRRSSALKLKRLDGRSVESFERWRTEFDVALPVGRAISVRALSLLRACGSVDALSVAPTTAEAVDIISTVLAPERIVETHKWRRIYRHGSCLVDDARFEVEGSAFRSIGVESANLRSLRTLVSELAAERLGSPCNYMQFLYHHA